MVDTLTRSRRAMVAADTPDTADTADTGVTATETSPAICSTLIALVAGGPPRGSCGGGPLTLRDGLLSGWSSTSSTGEDPARRRDLAHAWGRPGGPPSIRWHPAAERRGLLAPAHMAMLKAELSLGPELLPAEPSLGEAGALSALRVGRVFSPVAAPRQPDMYALGEAALLC